MDSNEWIILEKNELDEGIGYRFNDKEFTINAVTEGGYSGYSVDLTKEQASLLRSHLSNWLLGLEKKEE